MEDEHQEERIKDAAKNDNSLGEKDLPDDENSKTSNVNLLEKLREQFTGLFFGGAVGPGFFRVETTEEVREIKPKQPPPQDDSGDGERAKRLDGIRNFSMRPKDVSDYLSRFVIRQDEAKKVLSVTVCDHYNHVRRCINDPEELTKDYGKPNVLLLGPTGVGKTYLIRTLAKLLGVPFVKADATKFSETGYVGNDVDDLVRDLVRTANGDVELAQYGIIFIDEIDKIASCEELGRDVSGRGVQVNLLKLMEDTEVSIVAPNDITAQMSAMVSFGGKKGKKETIGTRHILFIMSGAFEKLNSHVRKRTSASAIGFSRSSGSDHGEDFLHLATTADFVQFGLEPEFIGRLPVRVACEHLKKNDLAQILLCSKGSLLHQYKSDFDGYGIELTFDEEAIYAIAELAAAENTGARGLMTVLERLLRDFKFHLPSSSIKQFPVSAEVVADPAAHLKKMLCGDENSCNG
ncbi:MAG: AAA family ATPase [Puniceicoccales bacterium]|jgi:endopeptidase Clp ATP-binding regulatory subunit ClpX|nr:AAA family ATPase [Puniceicoccales bacterium]